MALQMVQPKGSMYEQFKAMFDFNIESLARVKQMWINQMECIDEVQKLFEGEC